MMEKLTETEWKRTTTPHAESCSFVVHITFLELHSIYKNFIFFFSFWVDCSFNLKHINPSLFCLNYVSNYLS